MPGEFLDTNVLIYLLTGEAMKADRAQALLETGPIVSVQVLNEMAMVARRKINLPWPFVHDFSQRIGRLAQVVNLTERTHEIGLVMAQRHQLRIYDAMIVAAGLEAGCTTLWSEDMHNGLLVDGRLRIRNPFAAI